MAIICERCGCTAGRHAPDCPTQYTWPPAITVPEGWVCPKCGRVYGPHVDGCWWCNHPPAGAANERIRIRETLMPCGHPLSSTVFSDGGTAYCRECEKEAREGEIPCSK